METQWIPFSYSLRIDVVEQVSQVFDQRSAFRMTRGWWGDSPSDEKKKRGVREGSIRDKALRLYIGVTGRIHQPTIRLSVSFERPRRRRRIDVRRPDCFQDDVTRLPSNPSVIGVSHKDSRRCHHGRHVCVSDWLTAIFPPVRTVASARLESFWRVWTTGWLDGWVQTERQDPPELHQHHWNWKVAQLNLFSDIETLVDALFLQFCRVQHQCPIDFYQWSKNVKLQITRNYCIVDT